MLAGQNFFHAASILLGNNNDLCANDGRLIHSFTDAIQRRREKVSQTAFAQASDCLAGLVHLLYDCCHLVLIVGLTPASFFFDTFAP